MEKNEMSGAGCLSLVLMIPYATVINGFVLSVLWLWFFVPLGIPSIDIVHAMGIALLVNVMTNHNAKVQQKEPGDINDAIVKLFVYILLKAGFILSIGWLITLFM